VSPVSVGYGDLALAAILVVLNAALTWVLEFGLSRIILIAGVRAIVQLLLVGMVLKTVFALASPLLIGAVALAMFVMASYEISSRQERRFRGAWGYGIGAGTTMLATLLVTAFALLGTLRPVPWYAPQVLIPLLGIILGNVMNGVSVTLNALSTSITRERSAIEARLALGADRYAALKPLQRGALRSGMIPVINQMSAAGVITLPGIMTGQILAGMDAVEAAKYQILLLFLLGGGAGLGALAAVYVATWRITDERDRLRLDRLAQR
jgi:putative ABC transport system permease protein